MELYGICIAGTIEHCYCCNVKVAVQESRSDRLKILKDDKISADQGIARTPMLSTTIQYSAFLISVD